MSDSIQDRIASLTPTCANLLPMHREVIRRCIRQLDDIDLASNNSRYFEAQERYKDSREMLLEQLTHGDCANHTLSQFTRDRRQLAEMSQLRKKLGLDHPVENLDIN